MASPNHRAPVYIDIATAAALCTALPLGYGQAARVQPVHSNRPIGCGRFSSSFLCPSPSADIMYLECSNTTDNIFSKRNFITTWYMYALIAGEIGAFLVISGAFCQLNTLINSTRGHSAQVHFLT